MTNPTEDFRQQSERFREIRDQSLTTLQRLWNSPFHPSELLIHGAVILVALPIYNAAWDRFTQPAPPPIHSPLSVEILEIYR